MVVEPGPCCLNQDWTEEGPRADVPFCPPSPPLIAWRSKMRPPFSQPFSTPILLLLVMVLLNGPFLIQPAH